MSSIKGVGSNTALISVIMPVYNAQRFVAEAIESILWQSYRHWELIIVDDASTDRSWRTLRRYAKQETRIKIYRLDQHKGMSAALNFGLTKAVGTYLARMDADDISLPTRFAKQVTFLQANAQVIAVGTQTQLINERGLIIGKRNFPLNHQEIYRRMIFSHAINHSSLMTYTQVMQTIGYETKLCNSATGTLFKLLQKGYFANVPDILFQRRIHQRALTLVNPKLNQLTDIKQRAKGVVKWGYKVTLKGTLAIIGQFIGLSLLPAKWYRKYHLSNL